MTDAGAKLIAISIDNVATAIFIGFIFWLIFGRWKQ